MFGKLKEMAGAGVLEKVITVVEPKVREQLELVTKMSAGVVRDDAQYTANIVGPAHLALVAASNGVTKLVPRFEERFHGLMFRARDELLVIEEVSIRLVEDFQARLPKVIGDSFKA